MFKRGQNSRNCKAEELNLKRYLKNPNLTQARYSLDFIFVILTCPQLYSGHIYGFGTTHVRCSIENRSPLGRVTCLNCRPVRSSGIRFSTHSGATSPSNIIQCHWFSSPDWLVCVTLLLIQLSERFVLPTDQLFWTFGLQLII